MLVLTPYYIPIPNNCSVVYDNNINSDCFRFMCGHQ